VPRATGRLSFRPAPSQHILRPVSVVVSVKDDLGFFHDSDRVIGQTVSAKTFAQADRRVQARRKLRGEREVGLSPVALDEGRRPTLGRDYDASLEVAAIVAEGPVLPGTRIRCTDEVLHRLGRIPIPFVRQMVAEKVAETARAERVSLVDVPFFERAATF